MKKLIAIWILIALAGCGSKEGHPSKQVELPSVSLTVQKLSQTKATRSTEYAGTFVPLRSAKLATRLSGWITELRVEEGDFVTAGRTLVRIDAQDINAQAVQAGAGVVQARAQISQAQASVAAGHAGVAEAQAALQAARSRLPEAQAQQNLAKTEFKRMELLYNEGALSQLDYDRFRTNADVADAKVRQIRSTIHQAEAAVQLAQSSTDVARAAVGSAQAGAQQAQASRDAALVPLQYASVSSPIDGYVVKKMAYEGEMANPGQPLLEIQDTRTLRLEVPVPESALSRFEPNNEFPVKVDATGKEYTGRLDQIVPSGDPQSRTFVLKFDVENGERRLLPGMYGRIKVDDGEAKQSTVPQSAVVRRGEIEGVYVVGPENRAEYRLIKLGKKSGDDYIVLSGLEPDEQIVLSPPSNLKSGSPLELK